MPQKPHQENAAHRSRATESRNVIWLEQKPVHWTFAHLTARWRNWGGENRRGCDLPLQLCIGVKVHLSISFLKWKQLIEDLSCGVWWQTGCVVSPSIPSLLPCLWLMWRAVIVPLLAVFALSIRWWVTSSWWVVISDFHMMLYWVCVWRALFLLLRGCLTVLLHLLECPQ